MAECAEHRADTLEFGKRLGLLEPLGEQPAHVWVGAPTVEERRLAAKLLDDHRQRALQSAARSDKRTHAALMAWERFCSAIPNRKPFLALEGKPSDWVHAAYNRKTMHMFEGYTRANQGITPDTVAGYAGTIHTLRSVAADYCVLGSSDDVVGDRAAKQMRLEQGSRGERSLCRGVRAVDLRAAHAQWDWSDPEAYTKWSCALAAWNGAFRGADMGVAEAWQTPDPLVHLMWSHVRRLGDSRVGEEGLVFDALSSKDTDGRKKRMPVPFAKRPPMLDGSPDPLCPVHWVLLDRAMRACNVPERLRAVTLFYSHPDGSPYTSKDVAAIGKEIATLAGWSAEEVRTVGAKWARIGGATDLYEVFGEEGRAILKRRGRWASDLDAIYARTSLGPQLDASRRMAEATSAEFERAFTGFVQSSRM